jgi:biotin carboxyl carrier protein
MKYQTTVNNKTYEIDIQNDGNLVVNGVHRKVDFQALAPALYTILAEGLSHELTIEERDGRIEVLMSGKLYTTTVLDERALIIAQRSGGLVPEDGVIQIKAPMPGLIVAVKVEAGQEVKAGQTVVILESMKMQNELKSPRDGVIGQVNVSGGETVEQNKVLVTIT